MKYSLLVAILLLQLGTANAIQVNPDVDKTKTLTCTAPIEDTQGRPLKVGETITITLYTADSVNGPWSVAKTGTLCSFTIDATKLAEGFTYYEATATVSGVESARSNRQSLEVVITRIPKPPTNLGWQ